MAVKHIDYHTSKFGYSKPNVEFRKGYIERLKEAGIEDESQDIVMCVRLKIVSDVRGSIRTTYVCQLLCQLTALFVYLVLTSLGVYDIECRCE